MCTACYRLSIHGLHVHVQYMYIYICVYVHVHVCVHVAYKSLYCSYIETEKVLYSSIVCTMMFSTAEDVPLPVYGK